MTKTDRIYIRVTPEVKEELQALATAENRSLTNYIENLIKKEIEKKGGEVTAFFTSSFLFFFSRYYMY